MYVEQLASAFAEFGTSKPKHRNPSYALNVLQFIDGSSSEGKETTDSSNDMDSATESNAT